MPSEAEQIALLKAMLEKANKQLEERTVKLAEREKELKKREKELQKCEKKLQETEVANKDLQSSIHAYKVLHESVSYLLDEIRPRILSLGDLPEVEKEIWTNIAKNIKGDILDTLPRYKIWVRFVLKGSEKIGPIGDAAKIQETVKETDRAIDTRERKAGNALNIVNEASQEVFSADSTDPKSWQNAVAAANDVCKQVDTDTGPVEKKKNPGRQSVKFDDEVGKLHQNGVLRCPKCRSTNVDFGKTNRQNLRALKALLQDLIKLTKIEHRIGRCYSCNHVWVDWPEEADVPLKPGRTLGIRTIVSMAVACAFGVPLHRMKTKFLFGEEAQLGHSTIESNVYDFIKEGGCLQVFNLIQKELKSQHAIATDETPITVLQSQGRGVCKLDENTNPRNQDYITAQSSVKSAEHQCVIFNHAAGRSKDVVTAPLNDGAFKVLVTDGYPGYVSWVKDNGKKHQTCLMHLRRWLLDAVDLGRLNDVFESQKAEDAVKLASSKLTEADPPFLICQAIIYLQKVYRIEKQLERKPEETQKQYEGRIKTEREAKSTVLMDGVHALLKALADRGDYVQLKGERWISCKANSNISKALVYYMNHWNEFRTFLSDPKIDPDSGCVERVIRNVAMFRKSSDFKQSVEYTEAFCVLLSLVETAKKNGIADPAQWMSDFGRAYFLHKANLTVQAEVANGRSLNPKLMAFGDDSVLHFDQTFDWKQYLPWNYVKTHP